MADVTIEIGGRRYDVTCRDGEEAQLRRLADIVEEKAAQARAAVGGVTEVRQLLLASLLLADELADLRAARASSAEAPASAPAARDPALAVALERLAARVESVADHLEGRPVTA
jgi:cell division protein ZapA